MASGEEILESLWIETVAAWTCGFKAAEHGALFGQSRATVQKRLSRLRDRSSPAMLYDPKTRSKTFPIEAVKRLTAAPSTLWGFCDFHQIARRLGLTKSGPLASIDLCDLTEFGTHRSAWSPNSVQICRALSRREALAIEYTSKNKVSRFIFSPHAIVRTAHRIHFRGYGTWGPDREHYVDILPARVFAIHEHLPSQYVGPAGDTEWNTLVDVKARLANGLPEAAAKAIAAEYDANAFDKETGRLDPDHVFSFGTVRLACSTYALAAITERRAEQWEGPIFSVWTEPRD